MLAPRRETSRVPRIRYRRGVPERPDRDLAATEEPMEVRVAHPRDGGVDTRSVSVTMRTPGDDFELAAGFLFSEGLIGRRRDIRTITYCTGPETQEYNVVSVALRPGVTFDQALLDRNFYTTSSCGVCGKASLEAVEVRGCPVFPEGSGPVWAPGMLKGLPAALREGQGVFQRTGGIHAAALVRPDGSFVSLREDVGRHNAVDKVVGHQLLEGGIPADGTLLMVSGRTSFEILQKALTAGVPGVAAVGAPSSLAVDLAREFGMTLVGFLRDDGFNVYAGGGRVEGAEDAA